MCHCPELISNCSARSFCLGPFALDVFAPVQKRLCHTFSARHAKRKSHISSRLRWGGERCVQTLLAHVICSILTLRKHYRLIKHASSASTNWSTWSRPTA